MMTQQEIQTIVDDVQFLDWTFFIGKSPEGRLYLQIQFEGQDAVTGRVQLQKGRKWFLSPYMCKSELVRTAHKAMHAAVEHEADEKFLYRGRRIYGPHIDVDALHVAAKHIDIRKAETSKTWG